LQFWLAVRLSYVGPLQSDTTAERRRLADRIAKSESVTADEFVDATRFASNVWWWAIVVAAAVLLISLWTFSGHLSQSSWLWRLPQVTAVLVGAGAAEYAIMIHRAVNAKRRKRRAGSAEVRVVGHAIDFWIAIGLGVLVPILYTFAQSH
jgi:hypothetical protein